MRDEILLECKDCKECYIGTTHIDGYRCPMCGSGYLVGIGKIKELEESNRQLEIKIKSARWNGNIRVVSERERRKQNFIAGVDFGSGRDYTTFNIKDNSIVLVRVNSFLSQKAKDRIENNWTKVFNEHGELVVDNPK